MSVFTGHTAITVSNIEKSLEFYRDLIGLKVAVDFGNCPAASLTKNDNQTMRFLLLSTDDNLQCVELFEFEGVEQRRLEGKVKHDDFWSSHVAFLFDDIDEVYDNMVAHNVEIDVSLTEAQGYKFAYVYDPDGYMVELIAK